MIPHITSPNLFVETGLVFFFFFVSGEVLDGYDGHSWASLLGLPGLGGPISGAPGAGRNAAQRPRSDQQSEQPSAGEPFGELATAAVGGPRRTDTLIEYWGQRSNPTLKPPGFAVPPFWKGPDAVTWWQDQVRNTWSCVRMPPMEGEDGDAVFCQWFADWPSKANATVAFEEFYDLAADPYQLNNTVGQLPPRTLAALRARLTALRTCVGSEACNAPGRVPLYMLGRV